MKVRIAVAVTPTGDWSAAGWSGETESTLKSLAREPFADAEVFWVEAELPIPETRVVEGKVGQ